MKREKRKGKEKRSLAGARREGAGRRASRSKIIALYKLCPRDIYFPRTTRNLRGCAWKSGLSCPITFNANYSKICHSLARVSLRTAGSAAASVNLVIMSRVFFTKLQGSAPGRAKWLRLERRPFNYFVARTSTTLLETRTGSRTHDTYGTRASASQKCRVDA